MPGRQVKSQVTKYSPGEQETRAYLGVARHAEAEVVPEALADMRHEVLRARKAALGRLPLGGALGGVAPQRADVPDAAGLCLLQRQVHLLRLDVRASQVHVRRDAQFVHRECNVQSGVARGAPCAPRYITGKGAQQRRNDGMVLVSLSGVGFQTSTHKHLKTCG